MAREIRIFNFCWDKFVLAYKITCCNISVVSALERNEKRRHVIGVSLKKKKINYREGVGSPRSIVKQKLALQRRCTFVTAATVPKKSHTCFFSVICSSDQPRSLVFRASGY